MPLRPGRRRSFVFIAAVYVLAVAAAGAAFASLPWHPQLRMMAALLAATAVTYAATRYADNGSVFDAWWSVLPPFVAVFLVGLSPHAETTARQVAVLAVVWFWGVRLTVNWSRGWPGLEHEDWRYTDLYEQQSLPRWAVQLTSVELFPTAIVALGCLPLYPALARGDAGFHVLDWIALAVGLGATAIEGIADEQMHAFAARAQPGEVMERGLWRYSRHPNYFGEIAFWVSLWLFAMASTPDAWWTGIGAAAMLAMFLLASIPMLDRRSLARRPGFAAYARRTAALVPWPPRRDASPDS